MRELRDQHAALAIAFREAKPLAHRNRLLTREDRNPAVAGLLGGVPKRMVTLRRAHELLELVGVGLHFLETDDIRAFVAQPVAEAFAVDRPDTIYVPGRQFHETLIPEDCR